MFQFILCLLLQQRSFFDQAFSFYDAPGYPFSQDQIGRLVHGPALAPLCGYAVCFLRQTSSRAPSALSSVHRPDLRVLSAVRECRSPARGPLIPHFPPHRMSSQLTGLRLFGAWLLRQDEPPYTYTCWQELPKAEWPQDYNLSTDVDLNH